MTAPTLTPIRPRHTRPANDRAAQDAPLIDLLRHLDDVGYDFVTPTPATQARVLARSPGRHAGTLADMLGWSLPFVPQTVDPRAEALLDAFGLVEAAGPGVRHARIRVSRCDGRLFVHSAYPTDDADAVFLGPDSHRFAALIARELAGQPLAGNARAIDLGTGAGVGALAIAARAGDADVAGTDSNARALAHARVNAAAAGLDVAFHVGADFADVAGMFDLVVANPPYIIDANARAYRDGGAGLGTDVAVAMTMAALPRLAAGGRMILYCGSPVVAGECVLSRRIDRLARDASVECRSETIDPDVFGEELDQPAYRTVERIAVMGYVLTRTG